MVITERMEHMCILIPGNLQAQHILPIVRLALIRTLQRLLPLKRTHMEESKGVLLQNISSKSKPAIRMVAPDM